MAIGKEFASATVASDVLQTRHFYVLDVCQLCLQRVNLLVALLQSSLQCSNLALLQSKLINMPVHLALQMVNKILCA